MAVLDKLDPSHNILVSERKPLDAFFKPQSIAVIGATDKPGSVGRTILWNLMSSPFGGTIYPVNPKRDNVLGIKAYTDIQDIPAAIDLAVVVTPASTVPRVIQQCADAHVKTVIIISAGFKETGPQGERYEQEILTLSREHNLRIIGPNCLGVMNATTGLNATFAATIAKPGRIGFISQSGALCTAVLDWSLGQNVGFSKFISIGSMLDVDWGDLIYYLGDDPDTDSILIYMESIGNARSFMSAAREISLIKPIIVIKPGRSEEAAKAAASHTGSLSGSDEVLDAAFRRAGVLRVNTIGDLFGMAEVLGKQPRPKGRCLTILTNAGGPGVIATDSLIRSGGQLADLAPATIEKLNAFLPGPWSHTNPVDILGDADPARYAQAAEVLLQDPHTDGLLVILTPQAMTEPTQTAEALTPALAGANVPVLASWMGGTHVHPGERLLNQANIPTYAYPDDATGTFALMWQYAENLAALYETPTRKNNGVDNDVQQREEATRLVDRIRESNRTLLTEWESKQLLQLYQIPTVETHLAISEAEAVALADRIGYPVVLKLHSYTITHKTDIGGVQLNLKNADSVRAAFQAIYDGVQQKAHASDFQGVTVQPMAELSGTELILGSSADPQFGPVILFGSGGKYVEVYKDKALGLPPLNTTLARRMMEQTQVHHILQGVRGQAGVDVDALAELVVQFSQIVAEQPWIKEIEINPLLVSADTFLALDARVVLYEKQTHLRDIPVPAIRPYPMQYISSGTLKNGETIQIRPIRPEDEPLMRQFHRELSEETIFKRYEAEFKLEERTNHERLSRICFNDYAREIALVAMNEANTRIYGVVRLSRLSGLSHEAVFKILVTDRCQGLGLGNLLMERIIQLARQERINVICGFFNRANETMAALGRRHGFRFDDVPDQPGLYEVRLALASET